jgi:hypothetical protein
MPIQDTFISAYYKHFPLISIALGVGGGIVYGFSYDFDIFFAFLLTFL